MSSNVETSRWRVDWVPSTAKRFLAIGGQLCGRCLDSGIGLNWFKFKHVLNKCCSKPAVVFTQNVAT